MCLVATCAWWFLCVVRPPIRTTCAWRPRPLYFNSNGIQWLINCQDRKLALLNVLGDWLAVLPKSWILSRAYRPAQGGERASKCWRLLNLEPRFEWYRVRARHNALIYRPYKETANVFLVTASISPSVLAVWKLNALSLPSAGRYALDFIQIAWIFYPDDLDLDFIHQSLDFSYSASSGLHGL